MCIMLSLIVHDSLTRLIAQVIRHLDGVARVALVTRRLGQPLVIAEMIAASCSGRRCSAGVAPDVSAAFHT